MTRTGYRRVFILTESRIKHATQKRIIQRVKNRDGKLIIREGYYREIHCSICYRLLQVGDPVVSKRSSFLHRYYDLACAKKARIWIG